MTDFMESRAERAFRMLLKEGFLSMIHPGTDSGVCLFRSKRNLRIKEIKWEQQIVLHQAYWPASREEIICRTERKYRQSDAIHRSFTLAPDLAEFSKRSV